MIAEIELNTHQTTLQLTLNKNPGKPKGLYIKYVLILKYIVGAEKSEKQSFSDARNSKNFEQSEISGA